MNEKLNFLTKHFPLKKVKKLQSRLQKDFLELNGVKITSFQIKCQIKHTLCQFCKKSHLNIQILYFSTISNPILISQRPKCQLEGFFCSTKLYSPDNSSFPFWNWITRKIHLPPVAFSKTLFSLFPTFRIPIFSQLCFAWLKSWIHQVWKLRKWPFVVEWKNWTINRLID